MTKWIFIVLAVVILGIGGTYFLIRYHNSKNNDSAEQSTNGENEDINGEQAGRVTFKNVGPAPELKKIDQWLNGEPQTISGLKNQVILVNFWTLSCNSCITALSEINRWNTTYKDNGLSILSIHTPQYVFERVPENVQGAIDRFKVNYPVALDNSYANWTAFKNQFWPAMYLIDRNGNIVYSHFGDGGLKTTEKAIRLLLELESDPLSPISQTSDPNQVKSPTIPIGLKHLDFFANETVPSDKEKRYKFPENMEVNTLSLEGKWKLENEKAIMTQPSGKIRLKFDAAKVYLKATSKKAVNLKITVDGKTQLPVSAQGTNVYNLFDSGDYGEHVIEIQIPEPGFEALQFTFG